MRKRNAEVMLRPVPAIDWRFRLTFDHFQLILQWRMKQEEGEEEEESLMNKKRKFTNEWRRKQLRALPFFCFPFNQNNNSCYCIHPSGWNCCSLTTVSFTPSISSHKSLINSNQSTNSPSFIHLNWFNDYLDSDLPMINFDYLEKLS